MIEVIKAPLYRLCNCCGSNHHVIEIYFRSENIGVNQGTCVAICPDCFDKVQTAAITTFVRIAREETEPQPVVRCKDCKYKPFVKPEYKDKKYPYPFIEPGGAEIEFPDEENNPCPFLDGDPWGNIMPKDDFFCAHGARKGGEKDNA